MAKQDDVMSRAFICELLHAEASEPMLLSIHTSHSIKHTPACMHALRTWHSDFLSPEAHPLSHHVAAHTDG